MSQEVLIGDFDPVPPGSVLEVRPASLPFDASDFILPDETDGAVGADAAP
jgi:hypothetical protein